MNSGETFNQLSLTTRSLWSFKLLERKECQTLGEIDKNKKKKLNAMNIIYNLEELEGTCYIEILPGKYNGECWNKESIYFEEEVFGYLERAIEREYVQYDHYAFNEISIEVWQCILDRYDKIIEFLNKNSKSGELNEHIGFVFKSTEIDFTSDIKTNVESLKQLINEFKKWISINLHDHSVISVLGI